MTLRAEPLAEPSDVVRVELDRVHAALAGAAHELRGPATVLLALAELLSTERDSIERATFDRMLDAIQRQARVLDRVTADLLTATRTQHGVLSVDPQPALLRPLVESAAFGLGGLAEVQILCDPSVGVLADSTRVLQILGNLVANAIKYGAAPIRIVVTAGDDEVLIAVDDRGAGVPEQFRELLFEQFTRAEPSRLNGVGLGLYLVRCLVEAQGGRVWFEPRPDGGSVFTFTLPRADAVFPALPAS